MRRFLGRLLLGSLLAGLACLCWPRAGGADGPPAFLPPAIVAGPGSAHGFDAAANQKLKWMGTASCASTACHGANGPQGSGRSEYSTWAGHDKHNRAYSVLFNDRSVRIAANLYPGDPRKAAEQPLCLRCHAQFDSIEDRRDDRFHLADGVGCEACHGRAENWLATHYQAGFKGLPLEAKAALGMHPLTDLVHRANVCADCHVGVNVDKQVNHDLIAAGHPRLNFELAGYDALYKRHWNYADEVRRHPDFESRLWAIGQVVDAKRSLELLHSRAERAGDKENPAPWPEFAEYDCFACHKGIRVDSPAQQARWKGEGPKRRPGSLAYATWTLQMPLNLAGLMNVNLGGPDGGDLARVRQLMESPAPDAALVVPQAEAAVRRLDAWIGQIQGSPPMGVPETRQLLLGLIDDGLKKVDRLDWDETTQLYLAIAALHQGLGDLRGPRAVNPALNADIRALGRRLQLAFPPPRAGQKIDSPALFNPLGDPMATDPLLKEPLRQQLQAIRDKLQ
jgi:hypothetical protein